MNSGLLLLLICGLLTIVALVLSCRRERPGQKRTYALIVTRPAPFSAMMIGTGLQASCTTIPTILIRLSQSASASDTPRMSATLWASCSSSECCCCCWCSWWCLSSGSSFLGSSPRMDVTRLDVSRFHKQLTEELQRAWFPFTTVVMNIVRDTKDK